jgi:hypothetical protein
VSGKPYAHDRKVLVQLRELLAEDRRDGLPFAEAWPADLGRALKLVAPKLAADWRMALEETAGAWEHAYNGESVAKIEKLAQFVNAQT